MRVPGTVQTFASKSMRRVAFRASIIRRASRARSLACERVTLASRPRAISDALPPGMVNRKVQEREPFGLTNR